MEKRYPENNESGIFHIENHPPNFLSQLGSMYGTDKVSHGFCTIYEKYFDRNITNFLEIGVYYGSSIMMWRDYFTHAIIHGMDTFIGHQGNGTTFADADRFYNQCQRERIDRVILHKSDQSKVEDLQNFVKSSTLFDIILDDASHLMYDQQITFKQLFPLVKSGGYYVIEDVHSSHGNYDVLPDKSNTTLTMIKGYLDNHKLYSLYTDLSGFENQIASMQLFQTNSCSMTCLIKKV
jgi:hypothetical protein